MFSLPLITIFVDKKICKQNEAQYPITLPPYNTIFCGKKNEGIKIIDIRIIPKKKKNENKKFLIILIKNYINSLSSCLFLIILTLDPLTNISIGFGLAL